MAFRTSVFFFLFSLGASAATSTSECAAKASGFLEGKLTIWQQRLELQSWKITVVMSPASGLKPKTLGNVHWDTEKKTATIRVLDASDYQMACPAMLQDMEFTLVHELVHLEISSLPRTMASRGEEEQAVNRITDALLGVGGGAIAHAGLQPASSTE
ncbi:MAG: hypothetical protein ABSH50_18725 [Bryobacteraceae bacterium]